MRSLISYAVADGDDILHVRHAVAEALAAWGIRSEDGGDGVLYADSGPARAVLALANVPYTTSVSTVQAPCGEASEDFLFQPHERI